MQTPKHDGNGSLETSEHVHAPENEGVEPAGEDRSDMVATVATVAVVGIAAAAFQKTKEMLAEAHEQVNDIVAEVHAEGDVNQPASKPTAASARTREPNVPAAALPSISSSRSCARSRSADSQSDFATLQCRPANRVSWAPTSASQARAPR
jgi:hypothetical protein